MDSYREHSDAQGEWREFLRTHHPDLGLDDKEMNTLFTLHKLAAVVSYDSRVIVRFPVPGIKSTQSLISALTRFQGPLVRCRGGAEIEPLR